MKDCSSGKVCYMSKEMAEEALVENRARYHQGLNSGPINIYRCTMCDCYHFTSKGETHPMLSKTETHNKINKLKQSWEWENKLKGY